MKKYVVKFWYKTDCRCELEVEARNEILALVLAQSGEYDVTDWTNNGHGFKITIEQF